MVVPCEINNGKYCGDGLTIKKKFNDENLTVEGNGCYVKILENRGTLKIVGNGCSVSVKSGPGRIIYVGNGGHLKIGAGVAEANVTYSGCGGHVTRGKTVSGGGKLRQIQTNKDMLKVFDEHGKHFGTHYNKEGYSQFVLSLPQVPVKFFVK